MKQDKYIQALMNLGLTYLQAVVYLTLVKLGKAEAKTLSVAANVARADVYRVMASLEEIGLAEKIIANPTAYQATSLQEGYEILLKNKQEELSQLSEQTKQTFSDMPESDVKFWDPKQQFILISSEKLSGERIKIENENSTSSVDISGDWRSLRSREYIHLPIHKKVLHKGVKIRLITEKHDGEAFEKLYPSLFRYKQLFEIRYVDAPIPIRVAIYDRNRLTMSTRSPTDAQVTPTIWSNNPQFVNVIVAFFDQLWKSAQQTNSVEK